MISNLLIDFCNSAELANRLKCLTDNYFNLKLENAIRDIFLEHINKNDKLKAVAEYPRESGKRVDLGICNIDKFDFNLNYTVEFKYMFSGDYDCFSNYNDPKGFIQSVFRPDFERIICSHQTDMFILFVADWGKSLKQRMEFDSQFRIPINSLNKFQYPISQKRLLKKGKDNQDWLKNLTNSFMLYAREQGVTFIGNLNPVSSKLNKDILIDYHPFIIYR